MWSKEGILQLLQRDSNYKHHEYTTL